MNCSDKEIGKRIAKLRKEVYRKTGKRLTQDALADAVGLSRTIIAKIETGVQPLTPQQLSVVAKFFGVSIDYLVTGVSTENTTIAQDLGLAQESIEALKQWQQAIVIKGKSGPDDFARNRLYAINALIQMDPGKEILDDVFHYMVTDFENAWYANESLELDESDQPVDYFYESNQHPIKELHFDSGVSGAGTGVRLPVRFISHALLEDINERLRRMRDSISGQRKPLAEREKETEEEYYRMRAENSETED